jgi:hypothetical protein
VLTVPDAKQTMRNLKRQCQITGALSHGGSQ